MIDRDKFAEEEALGYNIYIVAKNFQLTEPMRVHLWEKLSKIERFHNHIFNVHATLEIQKLEHVVVLVCHFNHFHVKVEARSSDMYASIDKAIHQLQKLFRRWKDKMRDYAKKPLHEIDMTVNVYRKPYDEFKEVAHEQVEEEFTPWHPGKVMATETQKVKLLTMDEAIMQMELAGKSFMIYKDEADQKLKNIYRREDGNYGVIHIEA